MAYKHSADDHKPSQSNKARNELRKASDGFVVCVCVCVCVEFKFGVIVQEAVLLVHIVGRPSGSFSPHLVHLISAAPHCGGAFKLELSRMLLGA